MSDVVIGKHTLESLTSGMYSDPYVVYREYIQNATDSIDSAYETTLLKQGEEHITITLNPLERKIVIEDNGVGVSSNNVVKFLVSIGNSQKRSDNERGFRGIGRLSGLSYCSKLVFETSFFGESTMTRVIFDAKKLSCLLMDDTRHDVSVADVLQQIYFIDESICLPSKHFFRVIMEGVDESSGLNKYEGVMEFLTQNIPVPYSPTFYWGKEIVNRLKYEGYESRQYNIFLSSGTQIVQVYKPYKDVFLVDKGKGIADGIKDISIVKIQQPSGDLSAIGWIAETNYLGSIYDRSIKGIRIRKGGIQIGDSQTLNDVFKDARFNGWSIGELFVTDTRLVPNARRDNFEKNPAYFNLHEQLMTIASGITKAIRTASLKRNVKLAEAMKYSDKVLYETKEEIENGISPDRKGVIAQRVGAARKKLCAINPQFDMDVYYQSIALEELDVLIGRIQGATGYKAINITNSLNRTEKKVLEQVFNVIIKTVDSVTAEILVSTILNSFKTNTRKLL